MRVVFFGATRLSLECCRVVTAERLAEVVGVVTSPRSFSISYRPAGVTNVLHADLKPFAAERGLPCFEVEGRLGALTEHIDELRPDLLLVIGWYYLIPAKMRAVAPLGCVGIHASLLPKYRGGAPLVWAVINGETHTGVSLFHFDDGVDTGDIIAQESFEIDPEDTIADLLQKSEKACASVLRTNLPLLATGTAPRVPQDHTGATQFPQRSQEDGLINWAWSAERVRNFIRAQTKPYPGAFTILAGKRIRIWSADVEELP